MTFLSNFPEIGSIKKRNFSYKMTNNIKCYIFSNREWESSDREVGRNEKVWDKWHTAEDPQEEQLKFLATTRRQSLMTVCSHSKSAVSVTVAVARWSGTGTESRQWGICNWENDSYVDGFSIVNIYFPHVYVPPFPHYPLESNHRLQTNSSSNPSLKLFRWIPH